jgi:hypothetical protein
VLADTKYLCEKERDEVVVECAAQVAKLQELVVALEGRYERA